MVNILIISRALTNDKQDQHPSRMQAEGREQMVHIITNIKLVSLWKYSFGLKVLNLVNCPEK